MRGGRQGVEVARRDEPSATRAALRKRIPHVVNHDQKVTISQQFFQAIDGGIKRRKARTLAAEREDQVFDAARQIAGIFAERHPEEAIIEGVLNLLVVAERLRQRRFAVTARAAQCGSNRHRLFALIVEQQRE